MEYKIKSRIWIEADGEILLGEGRVSLLKAIDDTGSLSQAARSLGMSYKKAWSLIDAVNSRAKSPVCNTTIGGKKGGGTQITAYGKTLIETYENINKNCWDFLDEQISQANLK
jgi:molybdate transport system regulatory protein